ncbi:MAG TPA: histidine phosphatase family protein [Acidimicrobiales bacterium]|nr:histidine phosphatase family protein [Acidimicrobiales bacterium]
MLLLRHGQTTWNAERRWQGWADAPLSELGERQALDAATHLTDAGFTRVCASDLARARRTAELLAGGLGVGGPVFIDAGLRERDVGVFSGRLTSELMVDFPDCFDAVTGRATTIPESETVEHLVERAVATLVGLAERFPTDRLLVVSHGGLIGAVERHLGIERGTSVPNLGGRWIEVDAVSPSFVGGDPFVPLDGELLTAPASE